MHMARKEDSKLENPMQSPKLKHAMWNEHKKQGNMDDMWIWPSWRNLCQVRRKLRAHRRYLRMCQETNANIVLNEAETT